LTSQQVGGVDAVKINKRCSQQVLTDKSSTSVRWCNRQTDAEAVSLGKLRRPSLALEALSSSVPMCLTPDQTLAQCPAHRLIEQGLTCQPTVSKH